MLEGVEAKKQETKITVYIYIKNSLNEESFQVMMMIDIFFFHLISYDLALIFLIRGSCY